MNDVTRILCAVESGDPRAAGELLPLVYGDLRRLAAQKLARESTGQTLEATALVHEAYLRLVDSETLQGWNGRGRSRAPAGSGCAGVVPAGGGAETR